MNTPVVLHLFTELGKKYEKRELSRIFSILNNEFNVRLYFLCIRENALGAIT